MVASSILPLTLSGASVKRRGKTLVGPIDLTVEAGGLSIVMGPNGAGKTTLLRLMHGLERVSEGTKSWAVDEPLTRARQAYVFQTPILMRRTALENVAYPLLVHGMARKQALAAAATWLGRVGLSEAADRQAPVLSGGERQKLALARALIREPEILFLDEPCANLDGRATREIEEVLFAVRDAGTRIIMSTHDIGQARRLAGDVLFVCRGRVQETAPAEVFFNGPKTPEARAFLKGDIVE